MNKSSVVSGDRCRQIVSSAADTLSKKAESGRFELGSELRFEADVEQYIERNFMRISALLDDTSMLVGEGRLLGASASARASLETMAVLVEFFRRFKVAVKKADGNEIKRVLGLFIFASLEFSSFSLQKTPNVMDAVRNAERIQNGITAVYGVLCEVVHPNWSGRIQEGKGLDPDWHGAIVQRLVVAIAISASFSTVLIREFDEFLKFISSNRKNLQNAVLF